MVAPKERTKKVGKYSIYLWEHYDTIYNRDGVPRRGVFEHGEVAVFISGKQKSLQRGEDFNTKQNAINTYTRLSSIGSIEKCIKERGY